GLERNAMARRRIVCSFSNMKTPQHSERFPTPSRTRLSIVARRSDEAASIESVFERNRSASMIGVLFDTARTSVSSCCRLKEGWVDWEWGTPLDVAKDVTNRRLRTADFESCPSSMLFPSLRRGVRESSLFGRFLERYFRGTDRLSIDCDPFRGSGMD